jgi:hypothetical protein
MITIEKSVIENASKRPIKRTETTKRRTEAMNEPWRNATRSTRSKLGIICGYS